MSRGFFKVKVAILFGYNGRQFNGLQYQTQEDVKAIQNILLQTFLKVGLLREVNLQAIKKVHLSRAARTDKRVHALCNAISLKLDISQKFLNKTPEERSISKADDKHNIDRLKVIAQINALLPASIRIHAIKLTTKGFDIRHDAKSRTYIYLLPALVFLNKEQVQKDEQIQQMRAQQILGQLKELIKLYEGTHCFNNFTKGYKPKDKRCVRYIISMGIQMFKIQGKTYYRFKLVGQSFIYHQIRKMVGFLVQLYMQQLIQNKPTTLQEKKEEVVKTLKEYGRQVFLAPGEGLYLQSVDLSLYNLRDQIPQRLGLNLEEEQRVKAFQSVLQREMTEESSYFKEWTIKHLTGLAQESQGAPQDEPQ